MNELYELKEKLTEHLKDYGRRELNGSNLEVIDKLTHTIKNLCKIIEDSEGYSGRYDDGMRGRSYKRDSMGRYSRTGLTDKLRDLMSEAPDEHTRMEIKRLLDKMA